MVNTDEKLILAVFSYMRIEGVFGAAAPGATLLCVIGPVGSLVLVSLCKIP